MGMISRLQFWLPYGLMIGGILLNNEGFICPGIPLLVLGTMCFKLFSKFDNKTILALFLGCCLFSTKTFLENSSLGLTMGILGIFGLILVLISPALLSRVKLKLIATMTLSYMLYLSLFGVVGFLLDIGLKLGIIFDSNVKFNYLLNFNLTLLIFIGLLDIYWVKNYYRSAWSLWAGACVIFYHFGLACALEGKILGFFLMIIGSMYLAFLTIYDFLTRLRPVKPDPRNVPLYAQTQKRFGRSRENIHTGSVADRRIDFFISSTFSDMHPERDYLVKHIFPQIRKICEDRQVSGNVVDLRWGITQEQAMEGKVLSLCFDAIDRCRPFFIGILGERYGWIPDQFSESILAREPWLVDYVGCSVTELEIQHGVLRHSKNAGGAFFYFRDSEISKKLAVADNSYWESANAEEISKYGSEIAEEKAGWRRAKLAALKDQICQSSAVVRTNFQNPEELGELILDDLLKMIDELYPATDEINVFAEETANHARFAENLRQIYIAEDEHFSSLSQTAEEVGKPLVIYGPLGIGKSALLAKWVERYKSENPDIPVIEHYVGVSKYSTDYTSMLWRIMRELKSHCDLFVNVPTDPQGIREKFADFLQRTAAKKRVLLVIDGLDKLDDSEGALDLVWLPEEIPTNLRLILSTGSQQQLQEVIKRGWRNYILNGLSPDVRKTFICRYLGKFNKSLSSDLLDSIISKDQTRNPLILKIILDELVINGEYRWLVQQIRSYLEASTVKELFQKVLERCERDYDSNWPGLTEQLVSLLAVSTYGLAESEILDIIGDQEQPLPQFYWIPLTTVLRHFLTWHKGFMTLTNPIFSQVVEDKYLKTQECKKQMSRKILSYLESKQLNKRIFKEVIAQLEILESWDDLYALLSNFELFSSTWQFCQSEILRSWKKIEQKSVYRAVEAFGSIIANPECYPMNISIAVSDMLLVLGEHEATLSLLTKFVHRQQKKGDYFGIEKIFIKQARILLQYEKLDEALAVIMQAEWYCRAIAVFDKTVLLECLALEAQILLEQKKLSRAYKLVQELKRHSIKLKRKRDLAYALSIEARIDLAAEKFVKALDNIILAEKLYREVEDMVDLANTLHLKLQILQYGFDSQDEIVNCSNELLQICTEYGIKSYVPMTVLKEA